MDKLKNIINKCSEIEVKHKQSLQKLEHILKSEEKIESLENKELSTPLKRLKT